MAQIEIPVSWWLDNVLGNGSEMATFAVTAGLGGGKTHGQCQWHHEMVLRNQKATFSGFMEPTYTLIKTVAIPTYKKVLAQLGYTLGKDYTVVWGPPPKLIYKRSGHEVIFQTGDNPDLIVGVEFSHISIDEAGACAIESIRNFRARLRAPHSKLHQTMIVGAPQGVTGFAEEFDSDTLEGWGKPHWRIHKEPTKEYTRYIVHTDDNARFLPPGYIQNQIINVYGHNPNLIKSYRFGLFCPLVEGAAYSNYNQQKHDIDDIHPDPFKDIYFTFDFNANPLAWVTAQKIWIDDLGPYGYTRKQKCALIHESSGKSADLDDAVAEFAYKHPIELFQNTPIIIYGDRSGHSQHHRTKKTDYEQIAYFLRELGYKNVEIRAAIANPAEVDSVGSVQRMFLEDTLLVCRRLSKTRRSLLATTWKDNTRKLDKPSGDTWTHWMDAVKYLIHAIRGDFEKGQQIYGKNRF